MVQEMLTKLRSPVQSAAECGKEFAHLRELIKEAGLLKKQRLFYILQYIWVASLLTLNILILFSTRNLFVVFLNAALLSFTFGQIGMLLHDLGHQQVFSKKWKNTLQGYMYGFILGMSFPWWNDKHNAHHANPNHEDEDPDFLPLFAYTKEQAAEKKNFFTRFFVKYQAFIIIPFQCLMMFGFFISVVQYLVKQKASKQIFEFGLIITHFAGYFALVFFALGFWRGMFFFLVHELIWGFYMGMVFAPNHKGMPLLDEKKHPGFLRAQVLTSRNIHSHPILDIFYGGLNYQIEHHLFPQMPRNMLGRAQKIVKKYCKEKSISYHETGVIGSYYEIVKYMHEAGAVLRRKPRCG